MTVSSPGMRWEDDDEGWSGLLLPGPGEPNPWSLAARAVLLALLALWTLGFLRHGIDQQYLMGSFLHLIHLPFHEAGHVLLMPFGRFLIRARGQPLPARHPSRLRRGLPAQEP